MATAETPQPKNSLMLGVVMAALSFASLAVIVFFQYLVCFVLVAPVALRHGMVDLRTARIGVHLLRAATGTGAWFCLFYAITLMPLTNAVLLAFSSPIFIPLIAWMLHGRKVGRAVWAGVGLGFVGIALVLHPQNAEISWGAPLAVFAAICTALALLSVRWLGKTEPDMRILFYYFLLSMPLVLPFAAVDWRMPQGWAWAYLAGIGLSLLASQVFIIVAYRCASAVILAPMVYSVIVVTALINWAVWGRVPTGMEIGGMALVILGGLIAVKMGGRDHQAGGMD